MNQLKVIRCHHFDMAPIELLPDDKFYISVVVFSDGVRYESESPVFKVSDCSNVCVSLATREYVKSKGQI